MFYELLNSFLIFLIIVLPKIDKKNKFRLKLITHGMLNRFVLLLIICFAFYENELTGILSLILFFSILFLNKNIKEGFRTYYGTKRLRCME